MVPGDQIRKDPPHRVELLYSMNASRRGMIHTNMFPLKSGIRVRHGTNIPLKIIGILPEVMPQPRKPSPLGAAEFSGEPGSEFSGSGEMVLQKMSSTVFRYVRYCLIRDHSNRHLVPLDSGLSMPLSPYHTQRQAQNVSLTNISSEFF